MILEKFEQDNIAIDEAYQTINPKVDFKGWLKKIEVEKKAFDNKMEMWRANQKPSWSGGFGEIEDNIINPNPLGDEE